ncbi:MAG: endonuclease/exonuclease/phosphatase family protein [Candidatus Thermoplasmatota archaeon]|nr:endonuclease/exonuclease/phosphatase family protein [Candidatus Thermoplasmatota archaeon]
MVSAADDENSDSVELRIMTFNIFYGGDELDLRNFNWCMNPKGNEVTLEQVLVAILASDADVVNLQEGCLNVKRIADTLGWYSCERLQVISRFPLVDPPGGNGLYIFVEPVQGYVAALANVHLPADPYGPYEVRDGATLEEVIELEETLRLQASHESPAIVEHICVLPQLVSEGIPVFLTGDFNSPSHLDWTEEVAEVREVVRYPVEWPVAKKLAEAGFRDSYREVYPDPVAHPGFTWTPGSPEGVADEVHDRIDWVLAAGPSTTLDSQLMGEAGNPDVRIVVDPWPSDHRAVVSTFDIELGEMPPLVAVDKRRLEVGDDLAVRFHASGMPNEKVVIVPAGEDPGSAVASQPTEGDIDGTLVFATDLLMPCAYEAMLVGNHGQEVTSIPFWLYEQGAGTTVTTSKSVYVSGEAIIVSWTNAPGYFGDWLGLYRGDSNSKSKVMEIVYAGYGGGNMRYLSYEYTHGAIEGTTTFSESSLPGYGAWPLQPGTYEIRLLLDDAYSLGGSSMQFRVVNS